MKKDNGITLIALIVTVIVLLLLASVTVTIAVNGGLPVKTEMAAKTYSHASVYELMRMENAEYQLELLNEYEGSFIKYLNDEGIINNTDMATEMVSLNKENRSPVVQTISEKLSSGSKLNQAGGDPGGGLLREYKINVDVLFGQKSSMGNGKNGKDVYVIRWNDDTTSAESQIRDTDMATEGGNSNETKGQIRGLKRVVTYEIYYYGNSEDENKSLGTIENVVGYISNNNLEQEETYTVTYTDGVEGEEVFPDQVCIVKKGEDTPDFNGMMGNVPTREGYNFEGWAPTVAETVTENATYEATWSKK